MTKTALEGCSACYSRKYGNVTNMCCRHCTNNYTTYMTTPNGKSQYFFPIEQWHRYRWDVWHHLPENAKHRRSLCRLRIRWFGDGVFPPAPVWRIISAIYTFHCHGYKKENVITQPDPRLVETKSWEWRNLWSEDSMWSFQDTFANKLLSPNYIPDIIHSCF
jgi:hypothetical protein